MSILVTSFHFIATWLPLVYAIIGFGLLVIVHELGHFIFCKIFGIHTPTFSIGIGPILVQKKLGETNFCIAAIPIGGYLEIAGQAEVGQGEQKHAHDEGPNSFAMKPFWQKSLVMLGGVLCNTLFAYFVFSTLFFVGMPVQSKMELTVSSVGLQSQQHDGVAAHDLKAGDKILSIDGQRLDNDPKKLFAAMQLIFQKIALEKYNKQIIFSVDRDGQETWLPVTVTKEKTNLQRLLIGGVSLEPKTIETVYIRYPFFKAISMGITKTHEWIKITLHSLKMLFTKRNIKDFGGPIMIVSQSFKMAQEGFSLLFVFLAVVSINLAVMNLLPIGALDGGQLLFETIEFVIRRKIPEVVRLTINLMSWILILGLILFVSYQDVVALFIRK